MADVQDVLNAVVGQLAAIVYPNGTGEPSVTNKTINVFAGWPMPQQLDSDMTAGAADISVFPRTEETNTTRYDPKQIVQSVAAATLTLTVAGQTITVGGSMPSPFTPHNMAVLIGEVPFIYPVQPLDTLTSIATGLATLIAAAVPGTTNSGPVITVPAGTSAVIARVGTTGQIATEWERQNQQFQFTVWAPDPGTRATIGAAIKQALSQIAFIALPDGFGARIRYRRNSLSDNAGKVGIYRRDFFYEIEYATTVQEQLATVVTWQINFETQSGVPTITKNL